MNLQKFKDVREKIKVIEEELEIYKYELTKYTKEITNNNIKINNSKKRVLINSISVIISIIIILLISPIQISSLLMALITCGVIIYLPVLFDELSKQSILKEHNKLNESSIAELKLEITKNNTRLEKLNNILNNINANTKKELENQLIEEQLLQMDYNLGENLYELKSTYEMIRKKEKERLEEERKNLLQYQNTNCEKEKNFERQQDLAYRLGAHENTDNYCKEEIE